MTTTADLTPHTWQAPELTAARVAVQCAVQGNFARMEQHLRGLPTEALVDLRYALDVMHPWVRLLAIERSVAAVADDARPDQPMSTPEEAMLVTLGRVPCGRCGHDELLHEVEDDGFARCCLDCKGLCVPVVLVPAGVEGWAIDGRAGK